MITASSFSRAIRRIVTAATRSAIPALTTMLSAAQAAAPLPSPAQPPSQAACTALAQGAPDGAHVEAAEWVAAADGLPAHCLFRLTLDPRPSGLPDLAYGTGIELRLPADWNGRLLFQGGGGLNGVMNPARGAVAGFPSALARGFAVVATDGGHRGRSAIDARFGADQQARLDFGYQAVERTTREAKGLLQRFYGRKAEYTYFMGCSTGGREAMLAAQRLPLQFDGVVAGNPSYNLTRIAANQAFSLQQITRIAPQDDSGKPDLSRAISDEQLRGLAAAVLQRCDALDGIKDGLVNDYRACGLDPREQVCDAARDARGAQCLTTPQADALRAVFGGARNSRGEPLYGSTPIDTGIAAPVWRGMHLGVPGGEPANATLGRDTLRMFAMTPPDPDFDTRRFDFDRDMARTAETAAINDAVSVQHGSFVAHGGKMILYHGLSDQAMATGELTGWYDHLLPRDAAGPQAWARLFLVPGMTHCGGGQATDQFDMLAAIQAWVEKGVAPTRVVATGKAFPGRTRPLCPYPAVARFDGGDPESERSFGCR